jgi:hypothetical protein
MPKVSKALFLWIFMLNGKEKEENEISIVKVTTGAPTCLPQAKNKNVHVLFQLL